MLRLLSGVAARILRLGSGRTVERAKGRTLVHARPTCASCGRNWPGHGKCPSCQAHATGLSDAERIRRLEKELAREKCRHHRTELHCDDLRVEIDRLRAHARPEAPTRRPSLSGFGQFAAGDRVRRRDRSDGDTGTVAKCWDTGHVVVKWDGKPYEELFGPTALALATPG